MTQLQNIRDHVAGAFGARKSPWDRFVDQLPTVDVRRYAPQRASTPDFDATSLLIGVAVGFGLGLGLGYALKGNVKPAVRRAREKLPGRLNITRMEEQAQR